MDNSTTIENVEHANVTNWTTLFIFTYALSCLIILLVLVAIGCLVLLKARYDFVEALLQYMQVSKHNAKCK